MSPDGQELDVDTLVLRTSQPPLRVSLTESSLSELDKADLESRVEAARLEGEEKGYERACEESAAALDAAAQKLEEARERAEEELPRTAIDLAVQIAEVLLKVELSAGNYDIEKIVRSSLGWSGVGRGECSVHLNPDDVARLAFVPFRKLTKIEPDDDIVPGNCHVTTPQGTLVREFDDCLAAVRTKLLGASDEHELNSPTPPEEEEESE